MNNNVNLFNILFNMKNIDKMDNFKTYEYLRNVFLKTYNINIIRHNEDSIKNKKGCVFMPNHITFMDTYMFDYDKNLFRVAKKGIMKDFFPFINDKIIKKWDIGLNNTNHIMYEKFNKESGKYVKQQILTKINNNQNILLFPEGTTNRMSNNYLNKFRNGIFQLCFEHNIPIIPVCIIYSKEIGFNTNEEITIPKILNHISKQNDFHCFYLGEVKPSDFNSYFSLKMHIKNLLSKEINCKKKFIFNDSNYKNIFKQ